MLFDFLLQLLRTIRKAASIKWLQMMGSIRIMWLGAAIGIKTKENRRIYFPLASLKIQEGGRVTCSKE
jgi:hypothetical protein